MNSWCSRSGACIKRQRFSDHDGRDTLCLHSHGADESAVQSLLSDVPGYKATRCSRDERAETACTRTDLSKGMVRRGAGFDLERMVFEHKPHALYRFVNSGMVFVLFSDGLAAHQVRTCMQMLRMTAAAAFCRGSLSRRC